MKNKLKVKKQSEKMSFRGGFQFDEETKAFIKKIKSRKFSPPPPSHLDLPSVNKNYSYTKFIKLKKENCR